MRFSASALPISLLAFAMAPTLAKAAGISGNYVVGQWSTPIFSGCTVDAVVRSSLSCANTAATAVYSISNASLTGGLLSKSTLIDGANPGGDPAVPMMSTITFTGGTIPATHETVPFSIGTVTYTNGTSTLDSLIYGATLNLFASNGSAVQFIGSEIVQFNTTNNTGTAAQNADYLTFSGLAGISFEVYEGSTATGSLNGKVVGDPVFIPSSFTIDPSQAAGGFVGADPPLPTPEPASLSLIGIGIAGLGAIRRWTGRSSRAI